MQEDFISREKDWFSTIEGQAQAEIKVLASRFISYLRHVESTSVFESWLVELRRSHFDASHHCFAYRLGLLGDLFRYSDDGEPAGTAGSRIYHAIASRELTNVAVVVVRYFGGTKLGVGGLSRAYSDAAEVVLATASIVVQYVTDEVRVTFPYDYTSQVHHTIEQAGAEITTRFYQDDVTYTVRVRRSVTEQFCSLIEERTLGHSTVEVLNS